MEYTQLISRILDAEQSAQDIANEVQVREERLASEVEQEAATRRASLMAQADETIAELAKETEASRDQSLNAQDSRRDDAMARMEHAYDRYGDNWIDTLFHLIVGDHP